jgi:hypothetical protein
MLNSIESLRYLIEARCLCVILEFWICRCERCVITRFCGSLYSLQAYYHVFCPWILSYWIAASCHQYFQSKRTSKTKHPNERNVRINISFRLSWRFVCALHWPSVHSSIDDRKLTPLAPWSHGISFIYVTCSKINVRWRINNKKFGMGQNKFEIGTKPLLFPLVVLVSVSAVLLHEWLGMCKNTLTLNKTHCKFSTQYLHVFPVWL